MAEITSLRTWKNIIFCTIAFLLCQSSFFSTGIIMSSVALEGGLGVISQSVMSAATVLAATFVAFPLTRFATYKTLLVVSCLLYVPYMVSLFQIRWYTLIPAAVSYGIGSGIFFPISASYVVQLAKSYSEQDNGSNFEKITYIFITFLMMGNQLGHLLGSLFSHLTLQNHEGSENVNNTSCFDCCGIHFSDDIAKTQKTKIVPPETSLLDTLAGILVAEVIVAAFIIIFFVDKITSEMKFHKSLIHRVLQPLKLLRDIRAVCLVPFIFFCGIQISFTFSDFTKAYISCEFGIEKIGLVMISFGIASAIACSILVVISKFIPRAITFTTCSVLHLSILIFMNTYDPSQDNMTIVFVIAAGLGVCDAFWQSQVKALCGVLFFENKDAVFSLFSTFTGLSHATSFAYSAFLDTSTKLWILIIIVIVGYIGYVASEFMNTHIRNSKVQVS